MLYIYILKLENNKYYVGKTFKPIIRLNDHFICNGSYWTKKYKPISVIDIIPNADDFDEDKYTIKYMKKYGIENVRGGSFCQIILNDSNIITINQMINGNSNRCYICGDANHFAKECIKKSYQNIELNTINDKCNCIFSYCLIHNKNDCYFN
jgi:predicted GIY-YIG superfamily endonuclease